MLVFGLTQQGNRTRVYRQHYGSPVISLYKNTTFFPYVGVHSIRFCPVFFTFFISCISCGTFRRHGYSSGVAPYIPLREHLLLFAKYVPKIFVRFVRKVVYAFGLYFADKIECSGNKKYCKQDINIVVDENYRTKLHESKRPTKTDKKGTKKYTVCIRPNPVFKSLLFTVKQAVWPLVLQAFIFF